MTKEKKGKEKVDKKVENEEETESHSKKYAKQTKIAIIIMAVILASVFLTYWIVQTNRVVYYKGMKFYKEKEGSLVFYKSLLNYISYSGEKILFILKLRNDPRELEKIEVEGYIKNLRKKTVISLSPDVANCTTTIRTMIDFSRTLKAFGIETSAGTTSEEYSKENGVPLVRCEDAQEQSVIVIKEGQKEKITKTGDCYTIEIKNCEIQKGFEKFILEFIANSLIKT